MQIDALMFELDEPDADSTRYLIAWLDEQGNGEFCCHAHPSKTLLDVEPGHTVVHKKRTQFLVRRVKPYRTSECHDESQYPWVRSGRASLAADQS